MPIQRFSYKLRSNKLREKMMNYRYFLFSLCFQWYCWAFGRMIFLGFDFFYYFLPKVTNLFYWVFFYQRTKIGARRAITTSLFIYPPESFLFILLLSSLWCHNKFFEQIRSAHQKNAFILKLAWLKMIGKTILKERGIVIFLHNT